MPSVPILRASDAPARELLARVSRFVLTVLGLFIMLVGLVTAPLPGHLGLPILVVGLMIVLRNSFKARRRFVRIQKAHPKMIFPLRRLLRREPEVAPVAWQQVLRMERLIVPKRYRFAVRSRRWMSKRGRVRGATGAGRNAPAQPFPAE
ncbi:hypothetical protein MQH10_20870 [Phenylobacterium aquaticum]|nr:hypothetical protein [Phenylobacterium aquaticum]